MPAKKRVVLFVRYESCCVVLFYNYNFGSVLETDSRNL